MEFQGHGGKTYFGNFEGKAGGPVKISKPSMVWYGYFVELPNSRI